MLLATRSAPAAANSRTLSAAAEQQEQASAPPAPKKARPMPDQAEMRRQMLAYKQQVHELRLAYAKELQANAQQAEERKKAAAKLSARDDAVLTKERAERAEMKKRSVQQRMAELQKMKAERMQAGQVSFTAAAEKRAEKYLNKFSNMALEAKTWSASEESVESMIQDALVDVKRPQWRMPSRPSQKRAM